MNTAVLYAFLVAVLFAAPGQSAPPDTSPVQDERAKALWEEARRLLPDLGSSNAETKERVKARLAAIGKPALEPLERALYHEEPEVRFQAKELLKVVRHAIRLEPLVAPVREGVRKTRDRWRARDFTDLAAAAREAFRPMELVFVHYAPKLEIGDRLETDTGEARAGFRPLDRFGGRKDALTAKVVEALEKNDGLVFLGEAREPVEHSDVFVFTLPDRRGWSAYLVAQGSTGKQGRREGLPYSSDAYKSRLLAHAESRQVWGLDADEVEWAGGNVDAILNRHLRLSEDGGVLRVEEVTAGGIGAARGILAGDIVKDLNGTAVRSVADVKAVLASPAFRGSNGLRILVERGGKPLVLEYRPLPK